MAKEYFFSLKMKETLKSVGYGKNYYRHGLAFTNLFCILTKGSQVQPCLALKFFYRNDFGKAILIKKKEKGIVVLKLLWIFKTYK